MGVSDVAVSSFGEQERALRQTQGAHRQTLEVVTVTGPDAAKFLEGQVSQAVAAMSTGDARWSFVLHPQGKVVGLVRVLRSAPDQFDLVVDGGVGSAVAERLKRFLLRVKAEISLQSVEAVSLRGPEVLAPPPTESAVPALWSAWPGHDLLGCEEFPAGVTECGAEAWEAARIGVGLPLNGRELTEKTIPAESGMVDDAADFNKGCYVGQELVARIDSRGHVNRLLRRLSVQSGPVPPAGSELFTTDSPKAIGTVTSSAPSEFSGTAVALAYVRRRGRFDRSPDRQGGRYGGRAHCLVGHLHR